VSAKPNSSVAAIDIGHSTVKVAALGKKFMFPSVAIPALRISDKHESAVADLEKVIHNGKAWFFGETALLQGGMNWATGLSDDWIDSPEHSVLFLGALKKLEQEQVEPPSMVVMGLPVQAMKSEKSHSDRLVASISNLLPGVEVKVVPQPFGAFSNITLDANGRPIPERLIHMISWAVIDIGFYTTDFILMNRGHWIEMASDSCPGISMAAEHLMQRLANRNIKIDMADADAALRQRSLTYFGQNVDITEDVEEALSIAASKIIDTAERYFAPHASKLNGVLVAGGGAQSVIKGLKAKWPHVMLAEDPRMSVVEGMRRFGEAALSARARAKG
jgi:plasmid segregation protein ParM